MAIKKSDLYSSLWASCDDTRLVAEYLGHADLSTVSRYAHVAREELFAAAGRLECLAHGVELHQVQQT